jgi:hypothetical protein
VTESPPAPVAKVELGPVARDVLRAYAHHWRLLIPLTIVVLLPQALADAAFGEIEIDRVQTAADLLKLATIPLSAAINLGGEALLAGIIAAVVIEWRKGSELSDLRRAAREILYLRLIAIDLLLAIGFGVGLAFLVVPGIVFATYFLISPALVEVERLSIPDAIRKSIVLVRGNFWRVLVFALGFLVVTDFAATVLESPIHGVPGELGFNLVIEAALEPFQGLATVLLALALLDLHRETAPA